MTFRASLTLGLLLAAALPARAQVWNQPTGGSWATATNWTPNTVPNAIGATALFTGNNSASRTITVDSGATGFTVGALSIDTTGAAAFTNSITTGTTGSKLTFDNGGAGATLTTSGTGTGNNTISVPLVFTDTVTAVVNQTATTSATGSLNLTATITGTGGFVKQGDGLATFGTGTKTYTGATVLSGGRTRISATAAPTATSSMTVNAGAQLVVITTGTYAFGSGPLNLNGNGATTGPYAAFPGAIRNESSVAYTISNTVILQTNSAVVTSGTPAATSITFTGNVSGPGSFTAGSGGAGATGTIALNGTNTYTGGTVVQGGTLLVGQITGTSSATASLGTGGVTVTGAAGPSSLQIQTGVTDAIANTATLSLSGGGTAGTADVGFATLGAGVNEVVAGLTLAGVPQLPGTYGSSTSGATFQLDEFFSGPGILTVASPVPEPTGGLLAAGLAAGAVGWLRRRRNSPLGAAADRVS